MKKKAKLAANLCTLILPSFQVLLLLPLICFFFFFTEVPRDSLPVLGTFLFKSS